MENLKVGDTVRLKDGLIIGEVYDGFELSEGMLFNERIIQGVTDISYLIRPYYYPFSIIERVADEN